MRRPGGPPRAIERPKARLKASQRLLLREILDRIPAHPSSHGFVGGRSARTQAAEHTGRGAVLRFDLEDFFASVEARRVFGIFRTAGYAEGVAHRLKGLCTNVVPLTEWSALDRPSEAAAIAAYWRLGSRLATPHLPQGAPTSPALANLAAFSLDRRMSGLAEKLGARYTRYADDLVLSGSPGLAGRSARLTQTVAEIARDEGFRLHEAKTRVMSRAGRQQVCVIVLNEHLNVTRKSYDELKAILHNAARHGLAAENRAGRPDFRAHLLGRIAWVEQLNPSRGQKLRRRFAQIDAD
ncbi:MAG TPA: reverse transcriptase family protein [Thermoleophilaceae bacterium]|nr:reverse transcriptase family protein [Thermoleophilaceae bacterium]